MVANRATALLLAWLGGLSAALQPGSTVGRMARRGGAARAAVRAMQSGAPERGGGMVDGVQIGPPPDIPSLMLNNRIVYLGTALASQVTELIISELLYLQFESTEKPITMYINSPGTTLEDGRPVGYETEAFAIADTMAYVKPPIQTVLVGKAYGLSAMLLACGEKGKRTGLPYGTVMLHQPRGQQVRGQASDIAIKAREVLTNRQAALEIMSQATGVSVEQLAADTNRCKYMDAYQAVEYGIIDRVVEKSLKDRSDDRIRPEDISVLSRGLG